MERSWIFLMIVMLVALAHLQVGEKAAAEDNGDVKGLASLDHAGKSFFQEKPLEKNHNAEDEIVRHRWHQNAGEIRRRAIRQSERWTNEDKQKGRRIRKQQAVKEKRRRSGSDEYHRRRRDVHNNKQNMKGGKRRHRGDSDSGQGRRRKHRSNSLNRGRKEKFVRTSEKPRNSRRSVPIDSERRRTNRDPDNFYSREGQGKGVRRRKEKRRRPKIDGKGKKRGTKKDDDMKEKLNKKKASSRAKSAKSTGPKRKKVKKMKIILGKGGKKAIPKGSCKVSRIVSAADGNSAILFGYNMQKKGSCKMTFKAPKGSTLSLDCPQFDLNSKGCDQEGMQVYDKASKKNSEHCLTSGPKDWKSSGNVAAITFRREASKDKCGRNFVCQITVTGSPQTVKMLGRDGDCDKSISLSTGESAAIYTINGPKERNCKINLKGPKGTIFNITCPLLSMDGEYCSEQVVIEDEGSGSYGYEYACAGDKDGLALVTESHMASVEHDRQKDQEKNLCSAGFVCVASVVEWWDSVEPVPNYDPPGYRYDQKYLYPNTECPDKASLTGDMAKCEIQCLEDADCPPLNLCCPNGCGRVCVPPKPTSTDECGCSVSFLTQSGSYYEYYDEYIYEYDNDFYHDLSYYIYNDYADRDDIFLKNFIWESLRESFTPSMEPYIINPDFTEVMLGPYKTLCQLREGLESGSSILFQNSKYDVFRKKIRNLFIVTKRNETLEKISTLDLGLTYTTICLITIGNVEVPDKLLSQLTPLGGKLAPPPPCHWSVESHYDLQNLAPSIKKIINDGGCSCPGESGPVGPCIEEGGKCTKDDDCGKPTQICDKGVCKKQDCFQPDIFEPTPDTDYDFYSSFYEDPIDNSPYNFGNTYYHSYDYYAKEYDDIFYDDAFYTDFEASINQIRKSREPDESKSIAKPIINESQSMPFYDASGKIKTVAGSLLKQLTNRDVLDKFQKSFSDCCARNYFQCSGIPTMCLLDYSVCDGTPDCPLKDDESEEACAKRVCGEGWFKCQSGGCIQIKHTCDGIKDCADGSDEYCQQQPDCPPYRQHFCASGECISHYSICDGTLNCRNGEDELACKCSNFRCKSGECISNYNVCDNVNNCFDGSDEDCLNLQCPAVHSFRCNNGQCISKDDVCDGFSHCSDDSDEKLEICSPQECYFCPSGKCISKTKLCNGYNDCEDGKDESDCKDYKCSKGQFKCHSGECLGMKVLCNGREECVDGSDESSCGVIDCPDSRPLKCSSGECISPGDVCNGVFNCVDKSDESKCLALPCPSIYAEKCNSGECPYAFYKDNEYKCDGIQDCTDGSDELNCGAQCKFTCKTGDCLSSWGEACDGYRDCPDGSDEEDCDGATCFSKEYFRCNSGECIYYPRCDGVTDCRDGSDELNCEAYPCRKKYFKCNSGECISYGFRCSKYTVDCKDGSDEKGCKKKCWDKAIHCKSGECKDKYKFCDGYAQCFDGSDEKSCSDLKCPFYRPFKCGSGECRRAFYRCDGFTNCADGSDEANCAEFTCPPARPFSCKNGICITYYQVCNGYDDCGDGSDEVNCSSFKCPESTFQCKNGKCTSYYTVCNGLDDCGDNSDEMNCSAVKCPESSFQCKSGRCLPLKLVCNIVEDCPDGDDEANCKNKPK